MVGSKDRGPSGRARVRLIVFSITADWQQLCAALRAEGEDEEICAVTPHLLFPSERERLAREDPRVRVFRTFHDLLEREDMERCDAEADRRLLERRAGREGRVEEYYAEIMRLKNECAVRRLVAEFEVTGGALVSGDLGIAPDVWRELGLADWRRPEVLPRASFWRKLRKFFFDPVRIHYLECKEERWLLIGRPDRVAQYLDWSAVTLTPMGLGWEWWFSLQMKAVLKLRLPAAAIRPVLRLVNAPWAMSNRAVTRAAATVHEDHTGVARLAEGLGLEYLNLQDSFLPSYYPSRYLLYRPAVRRFLVWDNFSRGIFDRHGLASSRWEGFREWTLPKIRDLGPGPLRRVLYLSSGAGDWTALKNRSDEDLALSWLTDAARARPGVEFRYRPHPLWLHREHQGLNSIDRVVELVEQIGLRNLFVSQGARTDGRNFSLSGNLSSVSSSMDEDIAWAELVLGEHSQTMLVAAEQGKTIAGVNVSKHPSYFSDYAGVEFPLVSSAEDLVALVDTMSWPEKCAAFLQSYNAAIERHNRENAAAPEPERE